MATYLFWLTSVYMWNTSQNSTRLRKRAILPTTPWSGRCDIVKRHCHGNSSCGTRGSGDGFISGRVDQTSGASARRVALESAGCFPEAEVRTQCRPQFDDEINVLEDVVISIELVQTRGRAYGSLLLSFLALPLSINQHALQPILSATQLAAKINMCSRQPHISRYVSPRVHQTILKILASWS